MGPWLAMAILMAAPAPSPSPPSRLRLEGLDRLYFSRVARPPDTAALEGVSVRDIPLPVPGWPRSVVLRQVIAPGARIDELWLALHDGGQRSDVWHFRARPDLTDGKLLPNYSVAGARTREGGTIVLDLVGSMYRPQGGW